MCCDWDFPMGGIWTQDLKISARLYLTFMASADPEHLANGQSRTSTQTTVTTDIRARGQV